jgi:hypothetical protein
MDFTIEIKDIIEFLLITCIIVVMAYSGIRIFSWNSLELLSLILLYGVVQRLRGKDDK